MEGSALNITLRKFSDTHWKGGFNQIFSKPRIKSHTDLRIKPTTLVLYVRLITNELPIL